MKRFAEDTKEYSKEKNWWETIPLNRENVNKTIVMSTFIKSVENSKTKSITESSSKKKKHQHSRSLSTSRKSKSRKHKKDQKKDMTKLEKLRTERILREEEEKRRAEVLLNPTKKPLQNVTDLEKERSRKYNSQFNPEISKI